MLSVPYSDVQNRAAELAGRTRDKLPVSEALILQQAAAVALEEIWNKAAWPELIPPLVNVAPTGTPIGFSKNEGAGATGGEMGDILLLLTADPRATTQCRAVGFTEGDNIVYPTEQIASLFVEYVLPAPDLTDYTTAQLAAATVPKRFRNYVALHAAAHLLLPEGGDPRLMALAEAALQHQLNRLPPQPWWRNLRARAAYALPVGATQ